jgi:hypothetical protein
MVSEGLTLSSLENSYLIGVGEFTPDPIAERPRPTDVQNVATRSKHAVDAGTVRK